jgi:5'-nucleotidase
MKSRVFIDLDGVIVDFDLHRTTTGKTADELKQIDGAYLAMQPMPGALDAVRSIIGMGCFEVWIATKPPTGVPHAYRDKAAWVLQHLPELKRRIVITHDKGLLGCDDDFLIDDRPHKANCEAFRGTLIRFVDGMNWDRVLDILREHKAVCAAFGPPHTASRYGSARHAAAAAECQAMTNAQVRREWINRRAAELEH